MSRPHWFPPLRPQTDPADADVMLDCQGDWWVFGSPICKKPELCVAELVCYFVTRAAKMTRDLNAIRWSPGFDPEPQTLGLFEAA